MHVSPATVLLIAASILPAFAGPPLFIDLASETARQVVIDREDGQYLGHPTTCLLEDGKTMLCVYPKGHGRGAIVSNDEGETWTAPRELPITLTGDRHTGVYGPDGRLFISFRGRTQSGSTGAKGDVKGTLPTEGDWAAWVGTYDDIVHGRPGQYVVRLMDNKKGWDTTYPGVEILPDSTIVTTTYGHWEAGKQPWIVSVRLKLDELDEKAKTAPEVSLP